VNDKGKPDKVPGPVQVSVADLHIHIHVDKPTDIDMAVALKPLVDKINNIQEGVNQLMALSAESQALLAKMDAATTKVSDKIDALLANPNTTEAEFRAALQPIADHLDALGSDPANPVPATI